MTSSVVGISCNSSTATNKFGRANKNTFIFSADRNSDVFIAI